MSPAERESLAQRFRFTRIPLPEREGHPAYRQVRQVHPSLERISAWVSSVGAAATLADVDGDGLPNDVILVDPRTDEVTVFPVPGTGDRYRCFSLDPACWPAKGQDRSAMAPTGTVAGDFNEDGLTDVLVYFWGRTPLLYLREPKSEGEPALQSASFVPRELVDAPERWYSDCATQADFDGDGHLDLLVGNYFQDGAHVLDAKAGGTEVLHEGKSKALNGGYKHLFLWQGAEGGRSPGVRYREVRGVFPEEVARGWTVAIGACDLDGDLLPEIYFANDFGPDRLLHNRSTPGNPVFAVLEGHRGLVTPKSCVLGQDSFKGMGCDFGDLNGDGLPDIYVSNIATRFGLTESHFLWQSTGKLQEMSHGGAPYIQASETWGLSRSGFGWDARLADFDNDGMLEAMQACGFIRGKINRWPELQALGTSNDKIVHNPRFWPSFRPGADLSGKDTNPFFVRGGDGRYHDVAPLLGVDGPMVSRGIAIADVDGDGRLDYVCANQWGPSYVFRNEAPHPGAFLGLRLLRGKGTPAVGAVATVTLPDGRKQVSQVDGGSGHSGRRSPEIHLGLGPVDPAKPLPVELRWRDPEGRIRRDDLMLTPGWHTIRLGTTNAVTPLSNSRVTP